jgi:hypothetical protein
MRKGVNESEDVTGQPSAFMYLKNCATLEVLPDPFLEIRL